MSWPVSAEFEAALRSGAHTPTALIEILEGGQVVATSGVVADELLQVVRAGQLIEVSALDGSVISDRKAEVRRSATINLADTSSLLAPLLSSGYLHPLTERELRLWRGIEGVPANDTFDMVPMATVLFETLEISEDEAGRPYTIGGDDRSAALAEKDWIEPAVINGVGPAEATTTVLGLVVPGHTIVTSFAPTDLVLPDMTFVPGDDTTPWQAIVKFWEAAAMEVMFDQLGRLTSRPIPDPASTPPAFSFVDGETNIRVAPLTLSITRRSLRNAAVVRLSAPWALYGVTGVAYDLDPDSPTYYDPDNPAESPVGYHPEYIDDSFVATEDEANALAAAKLADLLGVEEQLGFSSIPHPGLEAGDVVVVGTPVVGGGTRYVLDQVTTPLGFAGRQDASARRRAR